MSSGAPNNKKPNKNGTKSGGEEIRKCGFGCGSDIFYSHEEGRMLEPRTRTPHTKKRCDMILDTKKSEQREKNLRTLRKEVIDDLKKQIAVHQLDGRTNPIEILFYLLKDRKFAIDAVSVRELAVAFFPNEVIPDVNGELQPTHKTVQRINNMLHKLRIVEDNKTTLIYAQVLDHGEWLLYNLQTDEDYKEVHERLKRQESGLRKTIRKNIEIIASGPEARVEAEKVLGQYFEELNLPILVKKKGGSQSAGGGIS